VIIVAQHRSGDFICFEELPAPASILCKDEADVSKCFHSAIAYISEIANGGADEIKSADRCLFSAPRFVEAFPDDGETMIDLFRRYVEGRAEPYGHGTAPENNCAVFDYQIEEIVPCRFIGKIEGAHKAAPPRV
jgi:hypothetical protein